MNNQVVGLGLLLIIVFWIFQMGYISNMGTIQWFLSAVAFVAITMVLGKTVMPKPSASMKHLWNVATVFLLLIAVVASFVPMSLLGVSLPANTSPSMFVGLFLSTWLIIYGAAMFLTGNEIKDNVSSMIGIVWLLGSVHLALVTGSNSYMHFGLLTGLPILLTGLLKK